MIKRAIRDFRDYATGLVAWHEKSARKLIAVAYTMGDTSIAAISPSANGFFDTVVKGNPDWLLLMASYADRPLPLITTCIFIPSSAAIGKYFRVGHAGQALGSAIIAYDFWHHNELATMVPCFASVIGGSFGASYVFLERRFGHAKSRIMRNTFGKPKKMAGFFFSWTAGPILVTSLFQIPPSLVSAFQAPDETSKLQALLDWGLLSQDRGDWTAVFQTHPKWALAAAATSWLSGNIVSMLLPRDDEIASTQVARPAGLPSASGGPRIESPR